jgi:16S rRNA (adenine1518-N6/adenine1519-N6)-dimethyltransferase
MKAHMRSRRKALGQHFLHDPNIIRKIIALADSRPKETVVEIGPGRGVLTRALCERDSEIFAIELDRRLYEELEKELSPFRNVHLIRADALSFPYENLPAPFAVVANLPYAISTPLLFRLLELRSRISRMVLMVQLEVARRIVARVGGKEYGPLSIGVQYFCEPRLEFIVPRGCFRPPPRVDSAVIRLEIRSAPICAVKDQDFFFRTVRAGFAHRRKSLRNALKDSGFPGEIIQKALAAASITVESSHRRAETLSITDWARLADKLFEFTSKIC